MGKKPSAKHSIERKNNNAGYSPENCCWQTQSQQVINSQPTMKALDRVGQVVNNWFITSLTHGSGIYALECTMCGAKKKGYWPDMCQTACRRCNFKPLPKVGDLCGTKRIYALQMDPGHRRLLCKCERCGRKTAQTFDSFKKTKTCVCMNNGRPRHD